MTIYLRNLLQIFLKPGVVTGIIPYFILRHQWDEITASIQLYHYLGGTFFILGWAILLHCNYRFAVEGKGTLSPIDPTKHLVIKGLYKYSRNPMYVAVVGILIGESIFAQNTIMWAYLAIVFTVFNLFIYVIEEPRLKKDFGAAYLRYCEEVRRWF